MSATGWQPIATAPKDETEILIWSTEHTFMTLGRFNPRIKEWDCDCFSWEEAAPLFWMPLPPPPASAIEAAQPAKRDSGSTEGESAVAAGQTPVPQSEAITKAVDALTLAEDVLSRFPFSADLWPGGTHPQHGITLIRDALTALQEQPAPVEVKPLEWWISDTGDRCADTIIGRYQIGNVTANARVRLFGPLYEIKPDEIGYWIEADAKAAAQADFERRILSALQPSTAREEAEARVVELEEDYGKLLAAFRVNALRYNQNTSHAEIDAEIARALRRAET